jgi:carboxyl-terminal processing protease
MPKRPRPSLQTVLAALLPVALVLGIWIGGHPNTLPYGLRGVFVDDDTLALAEGLDTIHDDYYRSVGRGKLVDDSLGGAVAKLNDRFSNYLDPKAYTRFRDSSNGEFSGVGVEASEVARGLRVGRVFAGSPASKAHIRTGDEIVAVNGRPIAGEPSTVTTALIRGRPGTFVTLTVTSHGRRRNLRLRRATVTAPSVTSSLRTVGGRRLGVVALAGFTAGAHGEVRQAVDRLRHRGARGIVLDLRGNGGGLLDEAVLVASTFIPEGTIVTTDGRHRARHVYRATGSSIPSRVPVVVLVDGNSASASEIVAGALQDRHRARVVGTRTYGKGVFQEVRELRNGGAMDITVGEYFTPSGRNLGGGGVRRGAGIHPDVPAQDRSGTDADEGLNGALNVLAGEAR